MSTQRWTIYWQSEEGKPFIRQSSTYATKEEAQEYAAGSEEDGYHALPLSGETLSLVEAARLGVELTAKEYQTLVAAGHNEFSAKL